mmetsp:Transcript_18140/g.36715  ORF Transcript_18140/g.36715 Transcript_18140/m.36715 type:complete len:1007 (+) Transcript_18140:193-3213(+)
MVVVVETVAHALECMLTALHLLVRRPVHRLRRLPHVLHLLLVLLALAVGGLRRGGGAGGHGLVEVVDEHHGGVLGHLQRCESVLPRRQEPPQLARRLHHLAVPHARHRPPLLHLRAPQLRAAPVKLRHRLLLLGLLCCPQPHIPRPQRTLGGVGARDERRSVLGRGRDGDDLDAASAGVGEVAREDGGLHPQALARRGLLVHAAHRQLLHHRPPRALPRCRRVLVDKEKHEEQVRPRHRVLQPRHRPPRAALALAARVLGRVCARHALLGRRRIHLLHDYFPVGAADADGAGGEVGAERGVRQHGRGRVAGLAVAAVELARVSLLALRGAAEEAQLAAVGELVVEHAHLVVPRRAPVALDPPLVLQRVLHAHRALGARVPVRAPLPLAPPAARGLGLGHEQAHVHAGREVHAHREHPGVEARHPRERRRQEVCPSHRRRPELAGGHGHPAHPEGVAAVREWERDDELVGVDELEDVVGEHLRLVVPVQVRRHALPQRSLAVEVKVLGELDDGKTQHAERLVLGPRRHRLQLQRLLVALLLPLGARRRRQRRRPRRHPRRLLAAPLDLVLAAGGVSRHLLLLLLRRRGRGLDGTDAAPLGLGRRLLCNLLLRHGLFSVAAHGANVLVAHWLSRAAHLGRRRRGPARIKLPGEGHARDAGEVRVTGGAAGLLGGGRGEGVVGGAEGALLEHELERHALRRGHEVHARAVVVVAVHRRALGGRSHWHGLARGQVGRLLRGLDWAVGGLLPLIGGPDQVERERRGRLARLPAAQNLLGVGDHVVVLLPQKVQRQVRLRRVPRLFSRLGAGRRRLVARLLVLLRLPQKLKRHAEGVVVVVFGGAARRLHVAPARARVGSLGRGVDAAPGNEVLWTRDRRAIAPLVLLPKKLKRNAHRRRALVGRRGGCSRFLARRSWRRATARGLEATSRLWHGAARGGGRARKSARRGVALERTRGGVPLGLARTWLRLRASGLARAWAWRGMLCKVPQWLPHPIGILLLLLPKQFQRDT